MQAGSAIQNSSDANADISPSTPRARQPDTTDASRTAITSANFGQNIQDSQSATLARSPKKPSVTGPSGRTRSHRSALAFDIATTESGPDNAWLDVVPPSVAHLHPPPGGCGGGMDMCDVMDDGESLLVALDVGSFEADDGRLHDSGSNSDRKHAVTSPHSASVRVFRGSACIATVAVPPPSPSSSSTSNFNPHRATFLRCFHAPIKRFRTTHATAAPVTASTTSLVSSSVALTSSTPRLSASSPSSLAHTSQPPKTSPVGTLMAVAAGPHVYVYRRLTPYHRITVPHVNFSEQEIAVWSKMLATTAAVDNAGSTERSMEGTVPVSEAVTQDDLTMLNIEWLSEPQNILPKQESIVPTPQLSAQNGNKELGPEDTEDTLSWSDGVAALVALRDGQQSMPLSSRSKQFIAICRDALRQQYHDQQQQEKSQQVVTAFINSFQGVPLKEDALIISMCTVPRDVDQPESVHFLVLGTENRMIYIYETTTFNIAQKYYLDHEPECMAVQGAFRSEYMIATVSRESEIHVINRTTNKMITQLEVKALALLVNKTVIVAALMNCTVVAYNFSGGKCFTLTMPGSIMAFERIRIDAKNFDGFLVAVDTGESRIYDGRRLVSVFMTQFPVYSLKFGVLGRDREFSLAYTTRHGALGIKSLRSKVQFKLVSDDNGPPKEQDIPLPLPKLTKSRRDEIEEADFAVQLTVQSQSWMKLQLMVARAYKATLQKSMTPVSVSTGQVKLKLQVEIIGLGPSHKALVSVHNLGQKPVYHLRVAFIFQTNKINLKSSAVASIILVTPGQPTTVSFTFQSLPVPDMAAAGRDDVQIVLLKENGVKPLLTSSFSVPHRKPEQID